MTAVLNQTNTVLSIIARKDQSMRAECYENVVLPLKVWIQDDYPRFMRDVEKVRKLNDQMNSAAGAAQRKNTEEKVQKFEAAKAEFNQSYEACKAELERMKKVNQHHMSCMRLMSQNHVSTFCLHSKTQIIPFQLNFFKTIDEELEKATEAMMRSVSSSGVVASTMKAPKSNK